MTTTSFDPDSRAGPTAYVPPPFEVSVRTERTSGWLVEVRGELDLCTGPMLEHELRAHRDASASHRPPRTLVYLLSGLGFIDARGLHYLLTAVDGHGPETITVRDPSPQARRLLELAGLGSLIEKGANP